VLPVELNGFDVDILLPAVFFLVVSEGKDRGRQLKDADRISDYVDKLAEHPDVEGFDDPAGRRVLNRLVRTSLVTTGRKGRGGGSVQQMTGINSYTFLAFKPGLPVESSSLRRVPGLIYRMMKTQLRGEQSCRDFFLEIFGKGVAVHAGPEPGGSYDGHTDLDTLTRLCIALLDGFESTGVKRVTEREAPEACPALADRMARDLRRYLEAYRSLMPVEALTYHLKGLVNLELFVYSIKLFYAVTDLVREPADLPPAMRRSFEPSPPELYLDFAGAASGRGGNGRG
jgi:hypothetical protein